MNTRSHRLHVRATTGFTLVEIMIVVVIIGLLASMAMPFYKRINQSTQNSRFISDLRTFSQAFETYAMKSGSWPPATAAGAVPTGMSGELNDSAWLTSKNSVGGRWAWLIAGSGAAAAVLTVDVTAPDEQMLKIDAKIDDGNLEAGLFRKIAADRFVWILELGTTP